MWWEKHGNAAGVATQWWAPPWGRVQVADTDYLLLVVFICLSCLLLSRIASHAACMHGNGR